MSKSQYQKRKEKSESEQPPVEPNFSQCAIDVYQASSGLYKVVEIEYDPETGAARVKDEKVISRLIALTFFNQRDSLRTLKRNRSKNEPTT